MSLNIHEAYISGRKELAEHLLNTLGHKPNVVEAVRRIFWTPAWCESDGAPRFFFTSKRYRYRFDCIGFENRPPEIENIQKRFLRTQVTTCWYLPLSDYPSFEEYLKKLSSGSRKKFRKLEKKYDDERIEFVPMTTDADMENLLRIILARWPDSEWGHELRDPLFQIYREFKTMGIVRVFLLRDAVGQSIAGSLGYLTGNVYNGVWLVRRQGVRDDLSSGFYHTAQLIRRLIEERSLFYIMGPGDYDRKRTFRASPLPIYRYETFTWKNANGLLKLCIRGWREKKKLRRVHCDADNR